MIHFVNPHGGFMPYSTLSLAGALLKYSKEFLIIHLWSFM